MKTWIAALALVAATLAQATPVDDLTMAAELNDPRAVTALLLKGVDPNLADSRGRTPLFTAVREGSLQALESLLAAPQLRIDAVNADGETPLMIAAIRGSLPAAKALVDAVALRLQRAGQRRRGLPHRPGRRAERTLGQRHDAVDDGGALRQRRSGAFAAEGGCRTARGQ
jgi:ankyrin repeat protein